MSPLYFLLILFALSSCDEYNSNSADRLKYDKEPQSEQVSNEDPNFDPAFAIIKTRCISCHTGFHNSWAARTNNDKWINSGIVNRGDPANSTFIKRIINTGGPGADMPLGMGPLPNSEYQLLRKWITEMP